MRYTEDSGHVSCDAVSLCRWVFHDVSKERSTFETSRNTTQTHSVTTHTTSILYSAHIFYAVKSCFHTNYDFAVRLFRTAKLKDLPL